MTDVTTSMTPTPRIRPRAAWLACLLALAAGQSLAEDDTGEVAAAPAVEEPTEEEIRNAYAASLAAVNDRTIAVMGGEDGAMLTVALEALTKLGCRGMNRPGAQYDCRVERRIKQGKRTAKTDVVQLWLAHEDGEWVAR
ncbi:hypothetical protein [Thiohalocapsa sp. ML1]|jgi:hypothetical protein|uniref:hypothetical protein n=1 Tax=Thiohalocapsa sp. ML1 TaxID=1431688 RepID=UPI0007323882|nr:hypothetical protein [Thiohalocapsa sp. ML1]